MISIDKELKKVVEKLEINIETDEVLKEIEDNFAVEYANIEFNDKVFISLRKSLKSYSKVALLGIANYFLPHIDEIKKECEEVILFDDYISNKKNNITNDENVLKDDTIECYIVLPRDRKIYKDFKDRIKNKDRVFWIRDYIIDNKQKMRLKEIGNFIDKNVSKNILIFLSGFFSNNYAPMFEMLEKRGKNTAFIVRKNCVAMLKNTNIQEIYDNVLVLNKSEFEYVLKKLPKSVDVFINWDSFRVNHFTGKNALGAILYNIAIFKILKSRKNLLLYDPSPLIRDEFKYLPDIMKAMGLLLNLSDRIIYNSSTKDMSEFQRNLFNINKPMINFYRYNKKLKKSIPKRKKDGFHLIMIGIFLDNSHDPMRSGMREYIKNVLDKKVHMHYLSYIKNDYKLEDFIKSLTNEQKRYFHVEETIVDQDEMIKFISQFNAGWMLHNTNAMCETISKSSCQEYKDMMHVFLEATATSSVLAHGSAGLPIFINRSMQGIQKEFPNEFFIPIELSEAKNIDKIIDSIDWDERYKFCYEHRGLFSIEENIDRLINFLKEFSD